MPLDVRLVQMPFAQLGMPSLALSQLKSVAGQRLGPKVEIAIEYLNHDFGRVFGAAAYQRISLSAASLYTGLGDWIFRAAAFPDEPDNIREYLRRYGRTIR